MIAGAAIGGGLGWGWGGHHGYGGYGCGGGWVIDEIINAQVMLNFNIIIIIFIIFKGHGYGGGYGGGWGGSYYNDGNDTTINNYNITNTTDNDVTNITNTDTNTNIEATENAGRNFRFFII